MVQSWSYFHRLYSKRVIVSPPGEKGYSDAVEFDKIRRVCLVVAQDWYDNDELYIFTDRTASYVVPLHADGAEALLQVLGEKNLVDSKEVINAFLKPKEHPMTCWPPAKTTTGKKD
jgi:hypothetical protein